ncbi:hypothetical protein B0F90DRAFT_1918412 [Multifurca ochricompacta]|uniref:Uncharacterized protein n=1 Tax=Multifurca ochricompacta TaxID=376703 RepID=A0AAD4M1D7_9AGAM|nr:hypothetical protein B0F90DRAFT_1918412 [Multifurca ochricompacta]
MANLASPSALGTFDNVDAVRAAYPMTMVEEKIGDLRELISKTPPGNSNHNTHIKDLVDWHKTKFSHTNDITDLEEVIKCRRVLLASVDTSHLHGFLPVRSLGFDLYMAFKCSNKMEYLDESITVLRGFLEMQCAQPFLFGLIEQLLASLFERLKLLGRTQDLDEIIKLFPLGVNNKFEKVSNRFAFSDVPGPAQRN